MSDFRKNRMKERLTLASGTYDVTLPLINKLVQPEGIDLNVLSNFETVDHIFRRMLYHSEFDISEMSIASYTIALDRGDKRFVAIPVFLNRHFLHKSFYCLRDSNIKSVNDLVGKSLALPSYQNTRWVWARGVLEDQYGISPDKIKWFAEHPERIELNLPPGVELNLLPTGMRASEALENGTVDAILYFARPWILNNKKIVKLFTDSRQEEINYYQKTKIFPPMHTVILKREILERSPWVAQSLMQAYQASKDLCYQTVKKLGISGGSSIIWMYESSLDQSKIIGDDPYKFGLKENAHTLEVLFEYLLKQGLISSKPEAADLFAKNALGIYG
ncbi:MAG: hypothetical protein ACE5KG_01055 [Nitrososphaerales archaeon]